MTDYTPTPIGQLHIDEHDGHQTNLLVRAVKAGDGSLHQRLEHWCSTCETWCPA